MQVTEGTAVLRLALGCDTIMDIDFDINKDVHGDWDDVPNNIMPKALD